MCVCKFELPIPVFNISAIGMMPLLQNILIFLNIGKKRYFSFFLQNAEYVKNLKIFPWYLRSNELFFTSRLQ